MYNKRLVSKPLDKLNFRIEATKSFDEDFDFGNGMNATELEEFSNDLEEAINSYNKTLSDADELRDAIRSLERQANDISDRLLSLVGGTYGKDSLQYQRMGGTRKSEILYTGTRPETFNNNNGADEGTSPDTGANGST